MSASKSYKLLVIALVLTCGRLQIEGSSSPETNKDLNSSDNSSGNTGAKLDGPAIVPAQQRQRIDETTREPLESAPTSVTSVHQVWTSSSSGRLDELSPEIIGKLRNDVPFLAAYALRPRLVGAAAVAAAAASTTSPANSAGLLHETADSYGEPERATSRFTPATRDAHLDTAASSISAEHPKLVASASTISARQSSAAGESLAPKLGDFSEFNMETASLSKSEHHHRRKTSLKRNNQAARNTGSALAAPVESVVEAPLEFASSSSFRRGRVLASPRQSSGRGTKIDSLGQLVKSLSKQGKLAARANKSRRQVGGGGGKRAAGKSSRRSKSARRTARTGKRSSSLPKLRASKVTKASKDRHSGRLLLQNEQSGRGDGDVKGGTSGTGSKTPFYATKRLDDAATKSPDRAKDARSDSGDPETPSGANDATSDDSPTTSSMAASGDGSDDSAIDEEPRQDEPKRVGDADVDELEGDTVLVEPKYDGVDDDPPLADENADDDGREGPQESSENEEPADKGATGSTSGNDDGATRLAPEADARGNRVNRQKPNEFAAMSPASGSGGGSDDDDENDAAEDTPNDLGPGSQVTGGGIGATVANSGGGGKGAGSAAGGGDQGADDADSRDGRSEGGRRGGASASGVEPADRDDERGSTATTRDSDDKTDQSGGSSSGASGNSDGAQEGGDFGERRPTGEAAGGGRRGSSAGGERGGAREGGTDSSSSGSKGDEDDDDLDYRDEMAEAAREESSRGAKRGEGSKSGHDRALGDDEDSQAETGREALDGGHEKTATNSSSSSSSHGHHCDDGSYDHHHDHHDSHHDTIDWLRGAIPGEPDDDYPILSRVNVTSFRCSDQKHPGYYADVESRCQIFHICQADGRQDSFLCPNGTIFSQRTLVCIWWNGFKCEDAPKYYHLNELLYKTTDGNESPQALALPGAGGGALRPLDGIMRPKSVRGRDNDAAPIDGLVRAMRGREDASSLGGPDERRGDSAERDAGAGVPARGRAGAEKEIGRGFNFRPDEDEATIQRKSTNLEDDYAADEAPARLRAKSNVPRRRRRASVRQAPPKLKSRRVSRNSRRRKLRHGIKPRRRA